MMSFRSSKSTNESNAPEFVFFQLLANDALIVLLLRDLVIFDSSQDQGTVLNDMSPM